MVLLATLFMCSCVVVSGTVDHQSCVTKQEFETAIGKLGTVIEQLEKTVAEKSGWNDAMLKRILDLETENAETKNRLSDLQNEFNKQIPDRSTEKTRSTMEKLLQFAEPIWQQHLKRNQMNTKTENDHEKSPGSGEVLADNGIPKHDRSSGKLEIRNDRSSALTKPHQLLGRQTAGMIAFSLFVTDDITNLGKDQIIKYQGIMVNDGNGYDVSTGIFTAPTSGLYLFSIFVEDYHDQDLYVNLRENGHVRTSAVAEPYAENQNVQGGNLVLLHVTQGSKVWVSISYGNRIQRNWSTFSGVLLH